MAKRKKSPKTPAETYHEHTCTACGIGFDGDVCTACAAPIPGAVMPDITPPVDTVAVTDAAIAADTPPETFSIAGSGVDGAPEPESPAPVEIVPVGWESVETPPMPETPESAPVSSRLGQLSPVMVTYRLRSWPPYTSNTARTRNGTPVKMQPPPWFMRAAGGFARTPVPEPGDEPGTATERGGDGSVWYFADESWVPHEFIGEMRSEFGCRNIAIDRLHPGESAKFAALAQRSLRDALNAQIARTRAIIADAEKSLADAQTAIANAANDTERAERAAEYAVAYANTVRTQKTNLKKLADWMRHTETAERAWGVASISGDMRDTVAAMVAAGRIRSDAYRNAAKTLRESPDAPIRTVTGVPTFAISDALRDAGDESGAAVFDAATAG